MYDLKCLTARKLLGSVVNAARQRAVGSKRCTHSKAPTSNVDVKNKGNCENSIINLFF